MESEQRDFVNGLLSKAIKRHMRFFVDQCIGGDMRNETTPRHEVNGRGCAEDDGSIITQGYLILSDKEVKDRLAQVDKSPKLRRLCKAR